MSTHMSPSQRSLWSKLEALTIGDPAASLGFAQRLARDNNWPIPFARRVIDEYKRFLFLAMESGHPVTPSDEVDQAWHLHLVYTDSYWNELCHDILPRPLHHGPTKGGKREGDKFNDWYARTLQSYQRFFGHAPPSDIWPDASIRFGLAAHFRRINTAENWVIPKRLPRTAAAITACTALSLTLLVCGLGLAQSGSRSATGLIATIVVIATAVTAIGLLALLLSRALSRAGHPGPGHGGSSGYGGFAPCGSTPAPVTASPDAAPTTASLAADLTTATAAPRVTTEAPRAVMVAAGPEVIAVVPGAAVVAAAAAAVEAAAAARLPA